MKVKLSKAVVRGAEPDPRKTVYLWDIDQYGFGLSITSKGAKSYFFSYSLPGWKSARRLTIGRTEALTLDQARSIAREMRGRVATGEDPAREREEVRDEPSVGDLCERFLEEHVEPKLRPSTARSYRQILGALPIAVRQMKVSTVTGNDIARLHTALRKRPYLANRTVAVLRKMFALAERWHLRPKFSNPASGHDPYPERLDRGSRFSDEQLATVGRVLRELEAEERNDSFTLALLRVNLLTGLRPLEVRSLRWEDVDLNRRVITLRAAKTGTRSGFLGKQAADLLASLPHVEGNPYCFPGRKEGAHLLEPKRLWEEIQRRAELPEHLRPYDLVRHTFNTVAQEAGVAPEMVRVLVGHVPASISDRYTHYALARTLEAADIAAGEIARLLGMTDSMTSVEAAP